MCALDLRKKSSGDLKSIIEELKDTVDIEQVVTDLGLEVKLGLQKVGNSLQGDCITGHASTGHRCFSIQTKSNYFHCFSCGEAGDIINLVALEQKSGKYEAIRYLVTKYAPRLMKDLDAFRDQLPPEMKEFYQRAEFYRAIFEEGKRLLYEPQNSTILDYLVKDRGYDQVKLKDTEFIYWDTDTNIKSFLKSNFPDLHDQADNLHLQGGFGDQFRLAIPFRDRHGAITGFLKRAHVPAGFNGIRWDSTKGLTKPDLFGFYRVQKGSDLIIVEGYPDATYFPAIGLSNVVALGQGAFSEQYLDGLKAKGIKRIIFALDNDGVGPKNTEDACKDLADSDIEVFVIDPPSMKPSKDPDEYVKANGVQAFNDLVRMASSSTKWMVQRSLAKHDVSIDIERSKAIHELLEYADSLSSPLKCETVLNALCIVFGLTPEILEIEFENLKKVKAGESLVSGVSDMSRRIGKLVNEGDFDGVVKLLSAEPSELLAEYGQMRTVEEPDLLSFISTKQARDASRTPGQLLGYSLDTFSNVSKCFSGIQTGLYIIGADPNMGKTALMVSLMIDLVDSNPEAAVLFFTMDDSRDTIINRLLAGKSLMEINKVQLQQQDTQSQQLLDDSYQWIIDRVTEKRLDIREMTETLTMNTIEQAVRRHPFQDKVSVLVDGLYNVPMEVPYGSLREENIDRANRIKDLVKVYNIPVIATAELRKKTSEDTKKKERTLHDIMETGKYGYNADVVFLLHPEDPDNYSTQDEPTIKLEFAKNKLSSYRGVESLTFVRAKSVMKPRQINSVQFNYAQQTSATPVPSTPGSGATDTESEG